VASWHIFYLLFLYGQGCWAFLHVFFDHLEFFLWKTLFSSFAHFYIGLLIFWEFSFFFHFLFIYFICMCIQCLSHFSPSSHPLPQPLSLHPTPSLTPQTPPHHLDTRQKLFCPYL
jgi:hypothetical protein